ncbi:hypothetical protein M405DRAFT_847478, partial [Rhizopogon salebrosus TDB-379]
ASVYNPLYSPGHFPDEGVSEGGSPELICSTSERVGGGYPPNFSKEEASGLEGVWRKSFNFIQLMDNGKYVRGVVWIGVEMGNVCDSGFCRTEDIDKGESKLILSVGKPRVDRKGKGGAGEGSLIAGSVMDGIKMGRERGERSME